MNSGSMLSQIAALAEGKLSELGKYGTPVPGHNGPCKDADTPVRVSAHRIFPVSRLCKKRTDERCLTAARAVYQEHTESGQCAHCC